MSTSKKYSLKRLVVIVAYALVFWIVLPYALIEASAYADKTLAIGFAAHPVVAALGIGGALLAAGLLILGIVQFHAYGKELPISMLPTKQLIQDGVYAIWRHPIYLFYTFFFAGVGLAAGSGGMLAVVLPVFAGLEWMYVLFEERLLIRRHGQRYVRYRAKTPLIVPNLYQALRIPAIVFAKIFFSYEIHGRRFPISPPFFVVAAHRNYFDPLFAALALYHPVSFVTTYQMFRTPLSAAFFRALFGMPRRRYVKDLVSGREILRRLAQDRVIGLFPESERSWTGEMGRFKPEAIKLMRAFPAVPVVPVRIDGAYHAWPRWANGFRRSKIRITVQEPLQPEADETSEKFALRLALSIRPVDAGFTFRGRRNARGNAAGIGRLIYRCPQCGSFDPFHQENAGKTACVACGLEIVVNPDCTLTMKNDGGDSTQTLEEIYQRIKINPHDLQCSGHLRPCTVASGSVIAESQRVMISVGNDKTLDRPTPGNLRLSTSDLLFCMDAATIVVPFVDIVSATIEGNSRLQIYRSRGGDLYEAAFQTESALKWQDYIAEAVSSFTSRTINRN